jgi:hypothetical protein
MSQSRYGLADTAAHPRPSDQRKPATVPLWIGHMVRAADGDVAFVHGLARMGAVGQFSMWLRVTFGPRKRDGAWQITYERESMPFYMDDFRAATDLEP